MSLTTGIQNYYKLTSNGTDSVGSNTLTGTSPSFSSSFGIIGPGANFVAASSQYLVGSNFAGGTSWAYNFWVNPQTLPSSWCPIDRDLLGTSRAFSSEWTATQVVFYAWGTGQNFHQTTLVNHGMSTGTWYMWTGVWDAANNVVTFYKNGVSFNTITLTGNENADTVSCPINLGSTNQGSRANYTNGYIDEVGYWTRALTSTEVTQLYNGGAGLQYPFSVASGNFLQFM